LRSWVAFALVIACGGCGETSSVGLDAPVDAAVDAPAPCFPLDGATSPDGEPVSFSQDVLPKLMICANFECHGGLAGNLDLNSGHQYTSLVGKRAGECGDGRLYVDPGHSDRSYFIDKLRGSICHCAGDRMPLGGPFLTDADIAMLITWVDEGAPNN
jgi:hypothetical protein